MSPKRELSRLLSFLQSLADLRETLPDKLNEFRDHMRVFPHRAFRWIRQNWILLWLGPQALVSFVLFFHGAGTLQTMDEPSAVAVIDGDDGALRERGEFAFRPTFSGTIARDWEGLASNPSVNVPFSVDGSRFILEPSSVVVFRTPFRGPIPADRRFRILKGGVTTENNRRVQTSSAADQTREIPKATGDALANSILAKIYPRLNSRLVVSKPGLAKIAFSWSHPQSGYVAVLSVESDQVQYIPIENVDHVHAPIQTDRTYAWQIVSPERKILEGPFHFQIASGGAEAWKRALTDPTIRKDKGGVDILLDE